MPGSLVFGANTTDRVDCGSGASLDSLTSFSWIWWQYATSDTGSQSMCGKGFSPAAGQKTCSRKFGDVDDFDFIIVRATTWADAVTTGVNRPLNAWLLVCCTYSEADGPRIYTGNLTTLAAEASYSTRDVGAGATGADAASSFAIGNRDNATEAFRGRIGPFATFGAVLTLAQVRSWQRKPRNQVDGITALGFWRLGNEGTGNQQDYSGNSNTGTVTGATQGDGVPLRQFTPGEGIAV